MRVRDSLTRGIQRSTIMEREDFWGCQLTKSSREHTWSVEGESELDVEHRLMVVQACLGPKRASKEVNVVQVTAEDHEGEKVICPIACLQEGVSLTCQVNLTFRPPVSFKLVEGSGPVALTGTYMQALSEGIMDEESSDEEEAPKLVELENKKRPLETPKGIPSKKAKVTADIINEDEESEDSEEEAEQNNSKVARKVEKVKDKSKGLWDDEAEESGSDGEDEDEDEDDEDEDDEDDEDEDESGEESSEDELASKLIAKKASKREAKEKPLINGADKKGTQKDTEKKGAPKDISAIKQLLLKSQSLPKTAAKFRNYMKSYKITDEKAVQDLWEWLQKNKK